MFDLLTSFAAAPLPAPAASPAEVVGASSWLLGMLFSAVGGFGAWWAIRKAKKEAAWARVPVTTHPGFGRFVGLLVVGVTGGLVMLAAQDGDEGLRALLDATRLYWSTASLAIAGFVGWLWQQRANRSDG